MEFAELIARARAGDRVALDEVYRRFSPSVLARLRGQLGPALRRRFDTEDLGQSVFAEVLRDLPKFESDREGAFRKWIALKVRSKLFGKLRVNLDRQGGRRERTLEGEQLDTGDPAAAAVAAEDRAHLAAALARLDEEERAVLRMRGEEGLPHAQIADLLGLPGADAARMRYARALLKLRELWTPR